MNPVSELGCPFCATTGGKPGIARHRPGKGTNPRYECMTCGCRFTLDLYYLGEAVTRRLQGAFAGEPPEPPRVNGHPVHPDGHYFDG